MTSSFLLALVCAAAVALAAAPAVVPQNSPQDYVNAHNTARANVGEGLPPVSWDRRVARYAQDYANQRARDCQLVHSGGPYGENIFWGSGRDYTAADAVRAWVAERRYYDYYSNTCATASVDASDGILIDRGGFFRELLSSKGILRESLEFFSLDLSSSRLTSRMQSTITLSIRCKTFRFSSKPEKNKYQIQLKTIPNGITMHSMSLSQRRKESQAGRTEATASSSTLRDSMSGCEGKEEIEGGKNSKKMIEWGKEEILCIAGIPPRDLDFAFVKLGVVCVKLGVACVKLGVTCGLRRMKGVAGRPGLQPRPATPYIRPCV
ncbi:hypothetical protein ZIOFF_062291 [Zingiber officinale]|uniref:SCP domain-containing protein n=1 Tax=Zingiber officinale TaxID=94328 RepID=A0A8J5F428_ZINOF|nr:hypothetical protein ZIOFF_062291 [Zingiber officinale]